MVSDKSRRKSWNVEKLTFPNIKLFLKKNPQTYEYVSRFSEKVDLQNFFYKALTSYQ